MGANENFTVVRYTSPKAPVMLPACPSSLTIELVGVRLDSAKNSSQDIADNRTLKTDTELERIRAAIETHIPRERHYLDVDPLGEWDTVRKPGSMEIFHFAGHGEKKGKGLQFRGKNGKEAMISVEKIVKLLKYTGGNGPTRLAFLNACNSTETVNGLTFGQRRQGSALPVVGASVSRSSGSAAVGDFLAAQWRIEPSCFRRG